MKWVFGGAMLVAVLAIAAPVGAEGPMTPVRPLSSPSAARQWVEPPPAPNLPAAPQVVASPAPPAPNLPAAPQVMASPAAPVAAAEPEPQASPAENSHPAYSTRRSARASGGRGNTTNRLNRQEASRGRYGGVPYHYAPYYGGYAYGPSPNGGGTD